MNNGIVKIVREKYFYNVYNDDAYIISRIMGYKLVDMGNDTVKAGFPYASLDKVLSILSKCQISYIVPNENLSKDFGEKNNYYKFLDKNLFVASSYYKEQKTKKVYQGAFSIKFEEDGFVEIYKIGTNISADAEIVEKVSDKVKGDIVTLNSGIKFQVVRNDLKVII